MVSLDGLPARMRWLPLDNRGYPVPRFVEWINGKPDFRVMNGQHFAAAVNRKVCWICGEPLGRWKAFIIGPMCSVNRVSSEPPSHRECATFAVKTCPFLTHPHRRRDDREMPEHKKPAGIMLEHNPGASLLWVTEGYKVQRTHGGVLFNIGDPREVEWWAHGRFATRAEVDTAFGKGLPLLRELADQDGPEACAELESMLAKAMKLLPEPA